MTQRLTKADVSRLLADPSGEARAEAAAKIAIQYESRALSSREREIAEEIIRFMVRDAEIRVRESLALHLKASDDLPRDVARALASDIRSVALPVLQFSNVLNDADLIDVVRELDSEKQAAIAGRKTLSVNVSQSLTQHGAEAAVAALMANPGADIGEGAYQTALDRFPVSAVVQESMVRRNVLPATVGERLVGLVSDALKEYLVTHHDLPAAVVTDLVLQSRERATVSLLAPNADDAAVERLVEQLRDNGRLTPSLVLRALCMGDVVFFETAIATLAGVPVANARVLIYDRGALGLRSLYERAQLPESLFAAYRVAVDVIHETEYDGEPHDRGRYRRRVMERILTQFEHLGSIGGENLDYLVTKLARIEVA
jgi:uncharacterized protein (DUF2336 family)